MNLTKCFAVGLCVTAMTASATVLQDDDFEAGFGPGWSYVPGTAIKDGTTGVTPDSDTPMVGSTDLKVVQLDTEGGIWTNTVGASFLSTNVFADMLVKFVPSEELPIIGTDVKLAIAVLGGTPNVLAISVIDQDNYTTNAWIITSGEVDTNAWTRLTVQIGNDGGFAFANILTNGVEVNAAPYYVNEGDKTLNSIGFQGTGFIDEVVVRDDDPFGGAPTYFATTGIEVNPTQLANWKSTFSVGTEVNEQYNAFLMNVAPDGVVSPTLVVNSIVKGATVTLTVKAKYANNSLVDLGTLNNGAELSVLAKVALADVSWTDIGSVLDFDPTTYKFFKVTVAVP